MKINHKKYLIILFTSLVCLFISDNCLVAQAEEIHLSANQESILLQLKLENRQYSNSQLIDLRKMAKVISSGDMDIALGRMYSLVQDSNLDEIDFIWEHYPEDPIRLRRTYPNKSRLLKYIACFYPEKAKSLMDGISNQDLLNSCHTVLGNGWAQVDVPGAIRWVQSVRNHQYFKGIANNVAMIALMNGEDNSFAMDLISAISQSDTEKQTNLEVLLLNWARTDPIAASEYLIKNQDKTQEFRVYREIVYNLTATSPNLTERFIETISVSDFKEKALLVAKEVRGKMSYSIDDDKEQLMKEQDLGERRKLIVKILNEQLRQNFSSALKWVKSLEKQNDRDIAFENIIERWVREDWRAALENLHLVPDGDVKRSVHHDIVDQWISSDPRACFEWIQSLKTGDHRSQLFVSASWSLVDIDPSLTLEVLYKLDDGDEKLLAMEATVRAMAQDGLGSKAYESLKKNVDGNELVRLTGHIVNVIGGKGEPSEALGIIENFPSGLDPTRCYVSLVLGWAHTDLEAASKWILTIEKKKLREELLVRIAPRWIQTDTEGLLEFIDTITEPELRRSMISAIAYQWSNDDPMAALTWVSTLNRDEKLLVMPTLMVEWGRFDGKAAGDFVKDMPANPLKDKCINALVYGWSHVYPEACARWALELSGSKERIGAITDSWHLWLHSAPKAAMDWMKSPELKSDRDELLTNYLNFYQFKNPEVGLGLAELLTDLDKKIKWTLYILQDWRQKSPKEALNWIKQSPFPSELKEVLRKATEEPLQREEVEPKKGLNVLPQNII